MTQIANPPEGSSSAEWNGDWVADRLDVSLQTVGDGSPSLKDLVGLAVRRNPRRAHLLVSNVLGKHTPTSPRVIRDAGTSLGRLVRRAGGTNSSVVIGFAETATALGQFVADELGAYCIHSTRRLGGYAAYGEFEEVHSHATSHALLPSNPARLSATEMVVLVDDELSTGATAIQLIRALHAIAPHPAYVVAALVDLRNDEDKQAFEALGEELNVPLDVVSLARGYISLPEDIMDRSRRLLDEVSLSPLGSGANLGAPWKPLTVNWPAYLPRTSRHGVSPSDILDLESHVKKISISIAEQMNVGRGHRILVLGTEELMYVPIRLAEALETIVEKQEAIVAFGSTTRSPVLAVDDPGYAIRSVVEFDDPEGTDGIRYVYNTNGSAQYDHIVLIVDAEATVNLNGRNAILSKLSTIATQSWLMVLPAETTA